MEVSSEAHPSVDASSQSQQITAPAARSFPGRAVCVFIVSTRAELLISLQRGRLAMHYGRLALAAIAAFVAYMALGGAMFAALPSMKVEFQKYPAVYRDEKGQMSHMPVGMVEILFSIFVLAALYAWLYRPGYGITQGAIFGVLIGLFAVCSFVLHNYVNLNIGVKITMYSALSYLLLWLIVGIVIGLIYRPAITP
jgi:hypothetical protein